MAWLRRGRGESAADGAFKIDTGGPIVAPCVDVMGGRVDLFTADLQKLKDANQRSVVLKLGLIEPVLFDREQLVAIEKSRCTGM